jgi:predicted GTPase
MKAKIICVILVVAALAVAFQASADKKEEEAGKKELETTIEHLLEFVRTSDVVFIRNGKEHSPEDAAKHIEKKYKHYKKKIKTPEDFIEKSATKSMMSGKKYQVRLKDGTLINTSDWLTEELERYRNAEASAPADTLEEGKECENDSL